MTATLNRVRDQVQVWTDTYERESPNLLGLQTELGRSIAQQIHLRLSPERARAMLAHTLSQQGSHQDALALTRRACELDPLNAMTHSMASQIAFQARDFESAVRDARQALLVEPDFWVAHLQLGQAHQQLGREAQALDALAEAARLSRGNTKPVSITGYTFATLGRFSEALEILESLERRSQEHYVPPYALALVHAGLKDRERMYECLDVAFSARDVHLIYLPVDPKWDVFRNDGRFIELLQRGRFLEA